MMNTMPDAPTSTQHVPQLCDFCIPGQHEYCSAPGTETIVFKNIFLAYCPRHLGHIAVAVVTGAIREADIGGIYCSASCEEAQL
jgi:hypothetical protein